MTCSEFLFQKLKSEVCLHLKTKSKWLVGDHSLSRPDYSLTSLLSSDVNMQSERELPQKINKILVET